MKPGKRGRVSATSCHRLRPRTSPEAMKLCCDSPRRAGPHRSFGLYRLGPVGRDPATRRSPTRPNPRPGS
ncbi:unnamed protein product, partial [Lampetra planeri]